MTTVNLTQKYLFYTLVLILWIKGLSFLQKLGRWCGSSLPFFLRLTAANDVHKHIFYILYNIIVLLYQSLYNILCLKLSCWLRPLFLMKGFHCRFLSCKSFHIGVSQRRPNLTFHQILEIYPQIKFMYKGLQIIQKTRLRCDASQVIFFSINIC